MQTKQTIIQRRTVLLGMGAAMAAPMIVGQLTPSYAADDAKPTTKPKNEKEFRMGVIGPATLSLMTSEIAVDRATNANTKEFGGFELEEAKAVTAVLKDLDTPVPPLDAKSQATYDRIKAASKGADFDRAYIEAQLENHDFLRDLAQYYLSNPAPDKSDMAEGQGRHLATLSLAVFKEHVAITTRIKGELKAA